MDKYTLEEIEAAFERCGYEPTYDELYRELTKPRYQFREGEVFAGRQRPEDPWYYADMPMDYTSDLPSPEERRPLRLSEMPQAVEDVIEQCKAMIYDLSGPDHNAYYYTDKARLDKVCKALAAFDEVIHD